MPSIAQGQRFTNTSSTQLVVGGTVLLFVVGLFFVPQVVPPRDTANTNSALEEALSFGEAEVPEAREEEPVAIEMAAEDIRARHARPLVDDIIEEESKSAFDRFDVASLLGTTEVPKTSQKAGSEDFVVTYTAEGEYEAGVVPAGPVDEAPPGDDRILVAETEEDTSALASVTRLLEDLSTPEHRKVVAADELVPDDMDDNYSEGGVVTVAMQQRMQGGAEENPAQTQAPKEGVKGKKEGPLFPEGVGVTWKVIHNGKNKRKIRKAGKNAQKIAISLGHKYQLTRFAIQNYSGGLNRVMIGKGISAHEVPSFLAGLEREVTVAMKREGVPQADVLRWAAITLGPELQSVLERQRKEEMVRPFNPKLRLSKLKIRQGYKHKGKWDPKARVAVKLSGYITGKHVKKIELFRNGKRVKKLPLEKRADDDGNRVFRMRQGQHVRDAVYTFRVTDSKDRVFEKSYLFYPKVRAFKWNGKSDGSFAIPFLEDDPRLDSFFRQRSTGGNGFGGGRTQVAFARF
jgi:hypothetical protein